MKSYIEYSDLAHAPATNYQKVGKVTAESVLKHTGKNWKQWITLLEKAGAKSWTYREIVIFLNKKHRLSPWWQQGVALGYEIAVGRRQEGQDAQGKYMVTATKSLPCGVKPVWELLNSKAGKKIWLQPFTDVALKPGAIFETQDGYFGEVRTITLKRRLRLYWQDPLWPKHNVLEVLLVPKPGSKSLLVFNHTGISDLKTKAQLRTRWRNAADQLRVLIAKEN